MVTNYPQPLTAVRPVGIGNLMSRTMTRLSQLICGMRGHEGVVHFEGKRVMMRCTSCGHDTPGWETGERAPRRSYEGDAQRHLLATAPPKLVLRRTA
jgi:hypothetical protein